MSNNVNLHLTVSVHHTADSDLIAMLKRLCAAGEVALHGLAKLTETEQQIRFEGRDQIVREAVAGLDPFIKQRVANYIDDKMVREKSKTFRADTSSPMERLADDLSAAESPADVSGVAEPQSGDSEATRARREAVGVKNGGGARHMSRTRAQSDKSTSNRTMTDESFDIDSGEWISLREFCDRTGHGYPKAVKWSKRDIEPPSWFRSHYKISPAQARGRIYVHTSSLKGA